MKTQLLEDFAESHSQAAIPTPAQAQAKKPGVWRARVDRAPQEAAPAPAEPPPRATFDEPPPRATFDESPPADESASKSPADDAAWLAQQQPAEPSWFDRWGRRVATSSLGVVIVGLLAGGAWWAMRERALDQTLAVVATTAHAQRAPMAAAPVAPSPPALVAAPPAASAPPVSVAQAMPAASAPPVSAAQAPPAVSAPSMSVVQTPPSTLAVESPTPVPEKPSPSKRSVAQVESAAPAVRSPTRTVPKHHARPPLVVAEHKEPPLNDLQETLRQCRAAGYHTTQCLKRGCVATKFGLACKG